MKLLIDKTSESLEPAFLPKHLRLIEWSKLHECEERLNSVQELMTDVQVMTDSTFVQWL